MTKKTDRLTPEEIVSTLTACVDVLTRTLPSLHSGKPGRQPTLYNFVHRLCVNGREALTLAEEALGPKELTEAQMRWVLGTEGTEARS